MSGFARYAVSDAPAPMRQAAANFEKRFGIAFRTLSYFPAGHLERLHAPSAIDGSLRERLVVAADRDRALLAEFEVLMRVANAGAPALAERVAYFRSLKNIYGHIGAALRLRADDVVLAPEREGRILADALGWLDPRRDMTPHAKRIPYQHGLLVGISDCPQLRARRLVCIDGAIASGATLIALLDLVALPDTPVEIYSVHAAREGIRAILRYAARANLDVRLYIGQVSEGLSGKFYAVDDAGRPMVGDLGDMIAGVAETVAR